MPADLPGGGEHWAVRDPDWAGVPGPLGRAAPTGLATPGLRSRSRRPFVLGAVAVAALLAGASVALAVTRSGSPVSTSAAIAATPAPSALPSGGPGRGSGFGGRPAPGLGLGHGMGPGRALHGQFVVARPGGGYVTIAIQTGQVTAASSASITIRSADGYTASYAVAASTVVDAQRDGISSIRAGNETMVQATVSGGAATAASITDLTLLQQQRRSLGSVG